MQYNIAFLDLPTTIIKQLKDLGYNNLNDIDPAKTKEILQITNTSSLQNTLKSQTALQLFKEELLSGDILSYNKDLDSVLRQVIVPNTITELAGDSGSGKTQLCFQLSISVQLPKWCGGLAGEALFIDTNNNFASHRVSELSEDFVKKYNMIKPSVQLKNVKFDKVSILQHIYYVKVSSITELLACIHSLENYISEKHVRVIVIDSIAYIIRLAEVKNRIIIINKIFSNLRVLCKKNNIAAVVTNDLTTRVNRGQSYVTPSFGDSFYHLINSRILLSKTNDSFRAKLEKNIHFDQKDTIFYL